MKEKDIKQNINKNNNIQQNNVYIYNVQPGVKINYATGEFEVEQ